ncbi:MAG: ATP-binding protein [Phycisphaerales bacterium]|nr:ATP-binding protein [Phycisphaerales bacterium]
MPRTALDDAAKTAHRAGRSTGFGPPGEPSPERAPARTPERTRTATPTTRPSPARDPDRGPRSIASSPQDRVEAPSTVRTTEHRDPDGPERALTDAIGQHRYDMWFAETARLETIASGLLVVASSPFVADWIAGHFRAELEALARRYGGADATVRIEVDSERFAPSVAAAPAIPTPAATMRPRRAASGDRRLDDFVVGPSNHLAYDAVVRLAECSDAGAGSLFIHGGCGVGKTHLLKGLCHRRRAHFPNQRVRYTTGEQFTNEYIAAVRNGRIDVFRERVRRLDLLAIDDVHFLSNKTATQSEFLHTIDAIDLTGARVALASDEHPRQIRSFSQSLVSRFLSGMVVRVDRPDRDMRIHLIRRAAAARGLRIAAAAEEAIASNFAASAREIEGAITKLAALMHVHGGAGDASAGGAGPGQAEIGMVLVQHLLTDQTPRSAGPVRFATIQAHVCERLAVDRGELIGAGRHRRVVLARGVVAYLARELTTMSFPEIARGLGRKNHSSVHTADQRVRRQIAEGQAVETGTGAQPMAITEMLDQLRHAIRVGAVPS